MKDQKNLSKEEMKNILGGQNTLPTCGGDCPCEAGCSCRTIEFSDGSVFKGCL